MKTNKMIEIENVKRANSALNSLLCREKTESVGIGLIYGMPGLGKTRWAKQTAIKHGYYYLQITKNHTTKTFLKDLLIALRYTYARPDDIYGTTKGLYDQILEILQDTQDIVIFVDEIDYAFDHKQMIATIRDFADQSFATFVLIGMHNARNLLLKLNAHYFDRCNAFCEFKAISPEDVAMILKGVCDVSCDKEIIDFIHKACKGTIRLIIKYVGLIELIAKEAGKDELLFKDIKGLLKNMAVES